MFEKSEMLYLYVETPLHAGSGNSVGVIDLPIQRERVTQYPVVQASGIKGKLRAEAYEWEPFVTRKKQIQEELLKGGKKPEEKDDAFKRRCEKEARKKAAKELDLEIVFGPEGDEAEHHAGALSPGDARLLLFPVRSLVGVFAWTTSRNVLARLMRDLHAAGKTTATKVILEGREIEQGWQPVGATNKNDNTALVCKNNDVTVNRAVVLEEFTFSVKDDSDQVPLIAKWLADYAIPQNTEYDYFRKKLLTNLVILPEDAFRDFTQFATEVVTRIRIDQDKKTVATGALWTEEHLPSDTVLYSPLHASRPRNESLSKNLKEAGDVLDFVRKLDLNRIQLGGDETVGRGIVKLRISGGENPSTGGETQ